MAAPLVGRLLPGIRGDGDSHARGTLAPLAAAVRSGERSSFRVAKSTSLLEEAGLEVRARGDKGGGKD
jgi:hypothetical protein